MTRQMSRFPRKRESRVSGPLAARAVCAIVLIVGAALPAGAADFYAGKTINFVVGTDVGGGFSIYARTIGKYLARYIPGNPTVVVKNMPGAGGATASAWLYRIAANDGTAIASVSPNAILGKLIDESQGQYDPARFVYLAGAERGTRLCMTFAHSRVKTLDDARIVRAVIGATSAGSPTREYAAMFKHTTGAKFEIVSGYKGPPDLFIAMERGENRRGVRAGLGSAQITAAGLAAGEQAQSPGAGRARSRSRTRHARGPDPLALHRQRHRSPRRCADGKLPAGLREGLSGAAGRARCPGFDLACSI